MAVLTFWHLHALLHQLAGANLISADQVGISCLICQKEKKKKKEEDEAKPLMTEEKHWCHCGG